MTSSLRKQYKTDSKSETEGVWVTIGTTDDDKPVGFKMKRMGGANKAYEKALIAGMKPIQAQINAGVANEAVQKRIAMDCFVRHVVADCENVEDFRDMANPDEASIELTFKADGTLACTPENMKALFECLPQLYLDLIMQARDSSIFREELLKAAAGN